VNITAPEWSFLARFWRIFCSVWPREKDYADRRSEACTPWKFKELILNGAKERQVDIGPTVFVEAGWDAFHSHTSVYSSTNCSFYIQSPSVLWHWWLGCRKDIRPVKTKWWDAGVVICLGRGADLHMAQLMPLPLIVSCTSKSRLVLPEWFYLSGTGSPELSRSTGR